MDVPPSRTAAVLWLMSHPGALSMDAPPCCCICCRIIVHQCISCVSVFLCGTVRLELAGELMSHLEAWILEAAAVCLLVHIRSLVDDVAGNACFCSFLIMYFCVHLDAFQSLEGVNDAQIKPIAVFLIKLKESVSQKRGG